MKIKLTDKQIEIIEELLSIINTDADFGGSLAEWISKDMELEDSSELANFEVSRNLNKEFVSRLVQASACSTYHAFSHMGNFKEQFRNIL
jgi:hypothetical protein